MAFDCQEINWLLTYLLTYLLVTSRGEEKSTGICFHYTIYTAFTYSSTFSFPNLKYSCTSRTLSVLTNDYLKRPAIPQNHCQARHFVFLGGWAWLLVGGDRRLDKFSTFQAAVKCNCAAELSGTADRSEDQLIWTRLLAIWAETHEIHKRQYTNTQKPSTRKR